MIEKLKVEVLKDCYLVYTTKLGTTMILVTDVKDEMLIIEKHFKGDIFTVSEFWVKLYKDKLGKLFREC